MNTLFLKYPYLSSQMVWFSIFLLLLLILSDQRRPIIWAGLFALPQALFAIGFIPEYWHPDRIFAIGVGPEDFIFSFFAGGLSYGCAVLFLRQKIRLDIQFHQVLKRYLICCLFGIVSITLLSLMGLSKIHGALITLILWGVILLLIKKRLWSFAAWGFVGFTIVYFLGFEIILMIWPDLSSLWTWENLMGLEFLGIPLEELIWASLYGPIWALTVAFLLNARITKHTRDKT